jgi:MFS family permease
LIAILGTIVLGIGFGLASGIYFSLITGLVPTEYRGGIVSLSESIGRLSSTISPLAIGGLLSFGIPLAGYTTALRWTIIGTGVSVGGLGIGCVLLAIISSPRRSTNR